MKEELKPIEVLAHLEKSVVLQETRCFDKAPPNEQEIVRVISKILYLLNKGEELLESECTELFFRVCKLYIVENPHIRKLLYLLLKELRPSEGEVFMITSSLSKDVSTSTNPYFRAGALRVMSSILEPVSLIQLERFIKNSIVDSNDSVCSAALFSGVRLCKTHPEVVKKWVAEVQDKLNSKSFNVHSHAMLLLFEMKKNDPMALSKFFENIMNANYRSPLAQTQVIRFLRHSMQSLPLDKGMATAIERFLTGCLKRRHDMVVYEAAKALCDLSDFIEGFSVSSALACLQLFLSSSKNTSKFAGIKTLNHFAIKHYNLLCHSVADYEPLLGESNRSLATMATSTLLKLSNEESVDRLLEQITSFMNEIGEDFKLELIESIKILCIRMPQKHRALITFMGRLLKLDGTIELKRGITTALLTLMEQLPESRDIVLFTLAEFTEDCPFELLQCQILHLLGEAAPHTTDPSKFIRYIYNRLILEKSVVRAAAVTALGKFSRIDSLKDRVSDLLKQCTEDKDDEVRERAQFYLQRGSEEVPGLPISIVQMEKALLHCQENGIQFSFEAAKQVKTSGTEETKVSLPETPQVTFGLSNIPGLKELGVPAKSTDPVQLTEKNAEFLVSVVSHFYSRAVVLEFNIANTIEDSALENVIVDLQLTRTPLEDIIEIDDAVQIFPCSRVEPNSEGKVWIKLMVVGGSRKASVPASLRFKVIEQGASYDDQYQIENVLIELTSY